MGEYEEMSYAERLHRQCPECKDYSLPAGKIICCQSCLSIINTETSEKIGSFAGGIEAYYENKLVPKEKAKDKDA